MVVLIPYVRETFRRHLSPNQAVMLIEFDKLKRVRVRVDLIWGMSLIITVPGKRTFKSTRMKFIQS
jgi:hypothetical protein